MKKIASVVLLTLGFASAAQAGFLFEPGVGYQSGTYSQKLISGGDGSSSATAPAASLRLGFRGAGLWGGVDGVFAFSGKLKPDVGAEEDFSGTTAYLAFGYDFASRFRCWLGVGVMDSLVGKDSLNQDVTFSGGTPLKVGIGYVVANHVSIDLEYMMHDYKNVKGTGYDGAIGDFNLSSTKLNMAALSVSFPFSF